VGNDKGWQWSILEKIKLKQICVQKNGGDTDEKKALLR